MKALMPTLRECKRYIGFVIESEMQVQFKAFEDAFEASLKDLIGTLGVAEAGAFVIKDRYGHNMGIVRVNNRFVDRVKMAFMAIRSIEGRDVAVRSVRTSGMINKVFPDGKKSGAGQESKGTNCDHNDHSHNK